MKEDNNILPRKKAEMYVYNYIAKYYEGNYSKPFLRILTKEIVDKAYKTFNPNLGVSFKTHLLNKAKEIHTIIEREANITHIPSSFLRDLRNVKRVISEMGLTPEIVNEDDIENIVNRTKLNKKRVLSLLEYLKMDLVDYNLDANSDKEDIYKKELLLDKPYLDFFDVIESYYSDDDTKLKIIRGIKKLKSVNPAKLKEYEELKNMDEKEINKHLDEIKHIIKALHY